MSKRYEEWCNVFYKDTKTGETSNDFLKVMNEQDAKISDLETKLAEKDEQIWALENQKLHAHNCLNQLKQQLAEKEKEKQEFFIKYRHWRTEGEQLKQQLAEKEKTIDEINKEFVQAIKDWKELLETEKTRVASRDIRIEELESQFAYEWECNKKFVEYKEEINQLTQQLAEKENTITALIEDSKASKELLKKEIAQKEKELEEINREFVQSTHDWKEIVDEKIKAKTEFAIQQLERVKESVLDISNGYWRYFMKNGKEYMTSDDLEGCLNETIDQIIKELEGKWRCISAK